MPRAKTAIGQQIARARSLMVAMNEHGFDEVEFDFGQGGKIRLKKGPATAIVEAPKKKTEEERPKKEKKTLEELMEEDPEYQRHAAGLPAHIR